MTEADLLLERLDAAPDATARQALLANCRPELLEQLSAALTHRQMCADVAEKIAAENAAHAAFTAELDAAADDAERVQVIEAAKADPARGPGFLAEWRWRRKAGASDWLLRYQSMLDLPAGAP